MSARNPTPGEIATVAALERAGAIIFTIPCGPGDKRSPAWFVGLGSHGDTGRDLKTAMFKCLKCCNIGMFWKMRGGKRAADVFSALAVKHLGGWNWSGR